MISNTHTRTHSIAARPHQRSSQYFRISPFIRHVLLQHDVVKQQTPSLVVENMRSRSLHLLSGASLESLRTQRPGAQSQHDERSHLNWKWVLEPRNCSLVHRVEDLLSHLHCQNVRKIARPMLLLARTSQNPEYDFVKLLHILDRSHCRHEHLLHRLLALTVVERDGSKFELLRDIFSRASFSYQRHARRLMARIDLRSTHATGPRTHSQRTKHRS